MPLNWHSWVPFLHGEGWGGGKGPNHWHSFWADFNWVFVELKKRENGTVTLEVTCNPLRIWDKLTGWFWDLRGWLMWQRDVFLITLHTWGLWNPK